jgi:hypothetical protein
MKPVEPPDMHHLLAASGWLDLGNTSEANEELERITPRLRAHPDVLEVRCEVYAVAKNWDACADIANAVVELAPGPGVGLAAPGVRPAQGHGWRFAGGVGCAPACRREIP